MDAHAGADQLFADIQTKIGSQMVVNEINDITAVWPVPCSTVAIVMDNTSPEMFADLVLGEYLIASGLTSRVVYMVKSMPWFVSDVTQSDFDSLLDGRLLKSTVAADGLLLSKWTDRWRTRFNEGSFVRESHAFWTMPFGYNTMHTKAIDLYNRLTNEFSVVIFKVCVVTT